MSFSRSGSDLLLEWCSARQSAARSAFETACRSVLGDETNPNWVLRNLEILGHVEVDWEGTGRWWVTRPVLSLVPGAGGNAVLVGARSEGTWLTLMALAERGEIASLERVEQAIDQPSAWFVGIRSIDELEHAASSVGAVFRTSARSDYKDALIDLTDVVAGDQREFPFSGLQAQQLDVTTLWFENVEVRYGRFPPGCFRQKSRGVMRYLFVDDDEKYHLTRGWEAVHAELDRSRTHEVSVPVPLAWSRSSGDLICDSRAQLPLAWARAAVFCTGLAPRRVRNQGVLTDIYPGVLATTYGRIAATLHCPLLAFVDGTTT